MTRMNWLAAGALLLVACSQVQQPDLNNAPSPNDVGDIRGVEEIGTPAALVALSGTSTFNSTSGDLTLALSATDRLLVVSKQASTGLILVNGQTVADSGGVMAVAAGLTGALKSINITVGAPSSTVVLDYLNGTFAAGNSVSGTASSPILKGTTVDFGSYTACSFKIRSTSGNDRIYMGKDKTASANKLVSFNNGNFGDIWIKHANATSTPAFGVSLADGNDTFNASPTSTTLGGLLTPWTDPLSVHGGAGNDTITGGKGSDLISGDEGTNFVDESLYNDFGTPFSASTTRQMVFASSTRTIVASGTAAGSFVTDGFQTGNLIMVGGTASNGSTLSPKVFTLSVVSATSMTVLEALTSETSITATITLVNTTHSPDTVYGLPGSVTSTTTVSYAARPFARAGRGVTIYIGHDTSSTPQWLGSGTSTVVEDNIDESVAVVIGTPFPDTLWCNDTSDVPCTLVGLAGDDALKAGLSSTSTHKLYGGDGADALIVTNNTDRALLMGGNWTDSVQSGFVSAASGTRSFTFAALPKTITASGTAIGSFVTDGFLVGMSVSVSGTVSNGTTSTPKTFTITGVTSSTLTVAETLVAETSLTAVITYGGVSAPTLASIDTVDFSAITVSGTTTIDLNFGYPSTSTPGTYTSSTPYSGAAAKKHINVVRDVKRALCPAYSGFQTCVVTANNAGNSITAGKGPDQITGGSGDDYFDLGAFDPSLLVPNYKQVNGVSGVDSVDFAGRNSDTAIDLVCAALGTCRSSGSFRYLPGIAITSVSGTRSLVFDGSASTITSVGTSTGSFLLEGFAINQMITVAGTGGGVNNGNYAVTGVTATVLSVTGTIMAAGTTSTAGATITRAAVTADAGFVLTATASSTLLFSSTSTVHNGVTSTISDISATGSPQFNFVTQGFVAGQVYTVVSASNNLDVTILSVSATDLVVAQQLTNNGTPSASATLTRAATSKVSEGVSVWNVTNATCPASAPAGALACYVTGNSAANFLDFNWCTGTLTCGGSGTLVVNIPSPDTVVGGAVCK